MSYGYCSVHGTPGWCAICGGFAEPQCCCDTNPATTDGPSIDCEVHGPRCERHGPHPGTVDCVDCLYPDPDVPYEYGSDGGVIIAVIVECPECGLAVATDRPIDGCADHGGRR